MSALLEVKDLKVHFPIRRGILQRQVASVNAVDGVTFEVEAGTTLGLVGESGCGKSTTGRAILRLVEPTSGSVQLEGTELTKLSSSALRQKRRDMQMIFQDPYASLNPRMTIFDIIAEPLRTHKVLDDSKKELSRVGELMEQVGLAPAYMRRYPHEFSGGQRQRIGIARAIALKPKLVIADEPVSALDVSIQAQIINLMMALQKDLGLAYVFIAHDLAVVRHLCKSIAVMYLGRVVEHAPTELLFSAPKHPYTKALLSAIPIPDPRAERGRKNLVLQGEVPSPIKPPSGCHFHPRCPVAFDRCESVRPELERREPKQLVSCHLKEDVTLEEMADAQASREAAREGKNRKRGGVDKSAGETDAAT